MTILHLYTFLACICCGMLARNYEYNKDPNWTLRRAGLVVCNSLVFGATLSLLIRCMT